MNGTQIWNIRRKMKKISTFHLILLILFDFHAVGGVLQNGMVEKVIKDIHGKVSQVTIRLLDGDDIVRTYNIQVILILYFLK